jgi:ribosomal silencing factor RsfS
VDFLLLFLLHLCRGRAGMHQQLVVATGLSQRHSHACAEAVAWQLKEKARRHLEQQQQQDVAGSSSSSSVEQRLPPLSVLGDASADWAVLDAGTVVVHVLTERARRFYNLEGLWGGAAGRFITWLKPEQRVETKDTIGRQGASSST